MRATLALLCVGLALGASQAARAQSPAADPSAKAALFQAVFAPTAKPADLVGPPPAAAPFVLTPWTEAAPDRDANGDRVFAPHAQFNLSNNGGSAEAGATMQLGRNLQRKLIRGLDRLGVSAVASPSAREAGRWFLFASASGREVGLNMTRDPQGQFPRLGWSAEGASAMISDAQAGVGWRRGDMQASFGYVHREVRPQTEGAIDPGTLRDSMMALSFSIRPR